MGLESLGSNDRTDAAVTLLSLKSTPQICTNNNGGVPLFDWSQVMPSLSYSQDNYSITLPHFEQALHTVPMPCHMKDAGSVCVAFTKFCQIHRPAIQFKNQGASPQLINTKLVELWEHMQDQERVVYSKVARNEALLLEGKLLSSQDASTSSYKVDTHSITQEIKNESLETLEISREQQNVAFPVMNWATANTMLSPGEVLYRADGTPVLTMPHISMGQHLPKSSTVENMAQDKTLSNTSKRKKVNSKQTIKALKEASRLIGIKSSTTKRERLKRSASQDYLFEDASQNGQIHKLDKSFFVRTRRHSMNDSILLEEKINPYFTKNYKESSQRRGNHRTSTISPVKTRVNISNLVSPKRNLSITSLNKTLCSPPKRTKNNDNIFDFQYTPSSDAFAKPPPPDHTGGKCDVFSYNLLEGASKTTAVNPSFSSRKMFVKRLNSLPNKCASMFKKSSKGEGENAEKERGDSTGRSMSSTSSSSSP